MNHKFAEEHEMISKARENFSKNKRIINIRDDFFHKICWLSAIGTESDHSLKFHSLEFLKLSTLIFFLLIRLTEFVAVRFNTFFFTSIKIIKSLVARSYALVWTMKFVRYSSVFELKLIKNQIVLGAVTFSISAAVLAWCRAVFDNKIIYQRFKTVRDLMLQQHNRLKDFAVEFVRNVKICAQYSSAAHQNKAWQDLNVLIINAKKRQKRVKKSIRFMKRRWSDETMNQLMLGIKDHHIVNEVVKLVKKYSINFEKIMKRLQLTCYDPIREEQTRPVRWLV